MIGGGGVSKMSAARRRQRTALYPGYYDYAITDYDDLSI